jgi:Ala-tRNA(Pro) deacylase
VHEAIGGTGRVSFGSAEQLGALLGVLPGSVTPLTVVNDVGGSVTLVLERALLEHEVLNVHPLENTATTTLARDDLLRFVRGTGHEPLVVDLPLRDG